MDDIRDSIIELQKTIEDGHVDVVQYLLTVGLKFKDVLTPDGEATLHAACGCCERTYGCGPCSSRF